jgi:hypothetical protein
MVLDLANEEMAWMKPATAAPVAQRAAPKVKTIEDEVPFDTDDDEDLKAFKNMALG